MIKVTAREFQGNQKKYLDMLEAGEMVEVRGLILTVYTPDDRIYAEEDKSPDRIYALEQLKGKVQDIESGLARPMATVSEDEPYIRTDGKLCECCQKGAEALYEVWEDGEERIVCELCLKNRHGKMWKQFTTSKIEDGEEERYTPSGKIFMEYPFQPIPELRPTSSSPKFSAPLWKQPKTKKGAKRTTQGKD